MQEWFIFVCEDCQVYFAMDKLSIPETVWCPRCGNDMNVEATGERIEGKVVWK